MKILIQFLYISGVVYIFFKSLKMKNKIFMLYGLFNFMYFYPIGYYIIFEKKYSKYMEWIKYEDVSFIMVLHMYFLIYILKNMGKIKNKYLIDNLKIVKNKYCYFITLCLMFFSFLKIPIKNSILFQKYSMETRGTIFFEYFIIFSLLNFMYSYNLKLRRINLIITSIYSVIPLFFGTRLVTIQLWLLIYLVYYEKKLSKKSLIFCSSISYIFFKVFENIRVHNYKFSIFNNFDDIMRSNQLDVWFANSIYIELINKNIFNYTFRIKSFIGMLVNIFVPSKFINKETFINLYIMDLGIPLPGNGGFPAIYAYLYLGYIGIILFSIIIVKIMKNGYNNKRNNFYTLNAILILTIFPRWSVYNIRIVFKFTIWLLLIYLFLENLRKRKV